MTNEFKQSIKVKIKINDKYLNTFVHRAKYNDMHRWASEMERDDRLCELQD